MGEAYKRQGYTVAGNARVGVDLVLRKGTEKTLVQYKHWKSSKVGVTIVPELYGVMTKEYADSGIVVYSRVSMPDAIEFVKCLPVQLVNGAGLKRLIVLPKTARTPNIKKPLCPVCGSDIIMCRTTKGRHVGKDFLGCRRFPKCRGTRKA